jgi:non-heme chloroperoxidase
MPYAASRDGTKLFYKDWGQGRPVVLIHGWPLSSDSWDAVSNALAESGNRVIAYDRRGFGRSDQPASGYDYDTFADDLADVMASAVLTNDVAVVGFSMGGGEIARYMSRHGGKGVRSAALLSSVVPYMLQTNDNPDGVPQSTFDEMTQGMLEDRANFMRGFLKDFYGVGILSSPVSDAVLDHSWAMCMQAGMLPTLKAAAAFATTDFRPDLSAFNVPTLVIHGTADKTVPIDATGRASARAIPGAQLIEYDGSPHGILETDTQRLIGDLTGWLASDSTRMGVSPTVEADELV